jgi:tryptophan synthase beta chain
MRSDEIILINLSGRGDKDIFTVADAFSDRQWRNFIKSKAEAYDAKRISERQTG